MAKKKRKPKEIHVDNLILKANNVVFQDEEGKERKEQASAQKAPLPRDPWGFFFPPAPVRNEAQTEVSREEESSTETESGESEEKENRPRGWSWL